jgi:hypothetical protein
MAVLQVEQATDTQRLRALGESGALNSPCLLLGVVTPARVQRANVHAQHVLARIN